MLPFESFRHDIIPISTFYDVTQLRREAVKAVERRELNKGDE